MMSCVLESGKMISKEVVDKVCDAVFESIKTELPEEAQSYDACTYVLDECKRKLSGKGVRL